MSNVNIPLLRKAVEWVEQQENLPLALREWYQGDWVVGPNYRRSQILSHLMNNEGLSYEEAEQQMPESCGTAYCVAGYIGQLLHTGYETSWEAPNNDGEFIHVSDFARQQLGITPEQARQLFAGGNTAADVRRLAEEFAGEAL